MAEHIPADVSPAEPTTVPDLPQGYVYRATRYADEILRNAFPQHYGDLVDNLEWFRIGLEELVVGGGNRTPFVARFDERLKEKGWGPRNFDIQTTIDGQVVASVRSHEIDIVKLGPQASPYPGIAIEMEWNNKDPFFDRDLTNFHALHRAGALAVGVIIILLVSIELPRIDRGDVAIDVFHQLQYADERLANWRDEFENYWQAREAYQAWEAEARQPLAEVMRDTETE